MELGLFELVYRPEEQLKTLAGGPGTSEMIVSLETLTEARRRALDLPARLHKFHGDHYHEEPNVIEKEVIVLHMGTIIVIPTVDNMLRTPLETYRQRGWPGLSLQSENYSSLVRVAMQLGNLPVIPEDSKYFRNEIFPNIRR